MERYQRLPSFENLRKTGREGRKRKSWRRSVIKEAGRSWNKLRFLAADRQKWKGLIDNLCSWKERWTLSLLLLLLLLLFIRRTSRRNLEPTKQVTLLPHPRNKCTSYLSLAFFFHKLPSILKGIWQKLRSNRTNWSKYLSDKFPVQKILK
jgi:hypothetical protein